MPNLFGPGTPDIERNAVLSECGFYRYRLTRMWGDRAAPSRVCAFVMLNPSTADAAKDDPTIRRCMGFARREGCDMLEVYNLYAYRATKPAELRQVPDPVGPKNRFWLNHLGDSGADIIIAAWGAHRGIEDRVKEVKAHLEGQIVYCLDKTKSGHPRHPLYAPSNLPLRLYWGSGHA